MDRERQLIDSVLAGNLRDFQTLVENYQRLVTHIVFRMVTNETDREEICQDVFIKVYQSLKNFKFQSKLSTWIGKIAHNTCINYLKKKKLPLYDDIITIDHSYSNSEGNSKPKDIDLTNQESQLPDEALISAEISGLLFKELNKLPAQYRAIVTLYHLDNMSYDEISAILELPLGTIKSYLFRARKLLKESILKEYQQEEFVK